MSEPSNPPASPAPRYTPPPELVRSAEETLAIARPELLALAAEAYAAYGVPTAGRSAISGTELPDFGACPPLVQCCWLSVAHKLEGAVTLAHARFSAKLANEEDAESAPPRKELSAGTITVNVPELKVDASDLEPQLDRLEGLVNQLSTAPVSMSDLCHGARSLAEAAAFLSTSDSDASKTVAALVQDMAKCLNAQVRELTPAPRS